MNLWAAALPDEAFGYVVATKVLVFFNPDTKMMRHPVKSRDGADTKMEEEPESYWQIWEAPGFCLSREDRKKTQPHSFM